MISQKDFNKNLEYYTLFILQESGKASHSILILLGIVSDEHFSKACLQILVTLFGIVIFVSDEHSEKAKLLISLILLEIVIFISDEQCEKTLFPIT